MTAYPIWRPHALVEPHCRKYQKKQHVAAVEATWALFQQISSDTNDLDNTPRYWPQVQARGSPAIQDALREIRGRPHVLAKASLYQLYFNSVRPNSHKEYLSPWQIIP